MKEEIIRQLLKEFDYDKNTLEDTLQFLLITCVNIVQLKKENPTCCLCGKKCENEFGNNAWPLKDNGKCCDECNITKVVPARMEMMNNGKVS